MILKDKINRLLYEYSCEVNQGPIYSEYTKVFISDMHYELSEIEDSEHEIAESMLDNFIEVTDHLISVMKDIDDRNLLRSFRNDLMNIKKESK